MGDRRGRVMLFLVIVLVTFMEGFGSTSVSVILPDIVDTYGIDTGMSSWIFTAYFLSMTVPILVVGRICAMGAMKRLLMSGLGLLSVGMLLSGLSGSFELFLVSRVVQGFGLSMAVTAAYMLPVRHLPKRLVAIGLVAVSAGTALGSLTGSVVELIDAFSSQWQLLFISMVPAGILVTILAWKSVPDDDFQGLHGFDYLGSVLLSISIVSCLYVMEAGTYDGLDTLDTLLLVLSVVTFLVFVLHCLRHKDPVMDLDMFRSWRVDACILVMMIFNISYVGCIYLMPLYISEVLSGEGISNGVLIFIAGVVNILLCLRVGRWIVRHGERTLTILACISCTCALLALVFVEMNPVLMLPFSALFLGMMWGLGSGASCARVVNNLPDHVREAGSALVPFFSYFGGAMGTGMYSAFFNIGSNMSHGSMDVTAGFMSGYMFAMIAGAILCVVGTILAFLVREGRDHPDSV